MQVDRIPTDDQMRMLVALLDTAHFCGKDTRGYTVSNGSTIQLHVYDAPEFDTPLVSEKFAQDFLCSFGASPDAIVRHDIVSKEDGHRTTCLTAPITYIGRDFMVTLFVTPKD